MEVGGDEELDKLIASLYAFLPDEEQVPADLMRNLQADDELLSAVTALGAITDAAR